MKKFQKYGDICIPLMRSKCKYRKLALKSNIKYYSNFFDVIAEEIPEDNLSKARNLVAAKSQNNVIAIVDCDIWIHAKALLKAMKYAAENDVVIRPYSRLLFLNKTMSNSLHKIHPFLWGKEIFPDLKINLNALENPYFSLAPGVNPVKLNLGISNINPCWSWGGAFVLNKNTFNKIKGFDENFKGYGYEDIAFARKLELMNIPVSVVNSDALHFFHTRRKKCYRQNFKNLELLSKEPYNLNVEIKNKKLINLEYPSSSIKLI